MPSSVSIVTNTNGREIVSSNRGTGTGMSWTVAWTRVIFIEVSSHRQRPPWGGRRCERYVSEPDVSR